MSINKKVARSIKYVIDYSKSKDLCDKSFEADTNIRKAFQKFTLNNPGVSLENSFVGGNFGFQNNDIDCSRELAMLSSINMTWEGISPANKSRFPTPRSLVRFLADGNNRAEAVRLGLLPQPTTADDGKPSADGSSDKGATATASGSSTEVKTPPSE